VTGHYWKNGGQNVDRAKEEALRHEAGLIRQKDRLLAEDHSRLAEIKRQLNPQKQATNFEPMVIAPENQIDNVLARIREHFTNKRSPL
jgi:hypothetical protein